jgi:CelD/BcsL family acetyltransferase involved in cellulose biosynthesis
MPELRVEIDDDPSSLHLLAPCWAELRRRARNATVFQDPAWLIPWHDRLGGAPLRLVAVWDGLRLVAFAPLQLWTDVQGARRLLLLGTGVTDYGDVLLDPDAPDAAAALADALHALRRDADVTSLEALRPEASVWRLAEGGAATAQAPCLVRKLAAPWTSRARRRRVLWHNRAVRRGPLRVEFARTSDEVERGMDALVTLHRARWQSRGEDGVLADPELPRFHREVARRARTAGLLRLGTLWIGDRIAAVQYGFSDGRMASGYLTGMDPDFAFESPGSLLLHTSIDAARDEGCTEFHFLRGDEPYKQMFADETRWNRVLAWTSAKHAPAHPKHAPASSASRTLPTSP